MHAGQRLCHGALRTLIVTPLRRPLRFHDGTGSSYLLPGVPGGKDRFTSRCVRDKWRSRGVTNEIRINRHVVPSHPPLTIIVRVLRRDAKIAELNIWFRKLKKFNPINLFLITHVTRWERRKGYEKCESMEALFVDVGWIENHCCIRDDCKVLRTL